VILPHLLWRGVDIPQNEVTPGTDAEQTDPDAAGRQPETNATGDWPVIYNQVTELPEGERDDFNICSEALTEEERAAIIPEGLPGWLELCGATAQYYGWSEEAALECVCLPLENPKTGTQVYVRICPEGRGPFFDEVLMPTDAQPTHTPEMDVVLYDSGTQVWTSFPCSGVRYYVSASYAGTGREEQVKEEFFQVVASLTRSATKPDLGRLHIHPEQHVLQVRELTPAEARLDPNFGAYYPAAEPDGLAREQISRLQNSDWSINSLSAFWNSGYDYLTWEIRSMSEYDTRKIVSSGERERYDLTLYSIPLAESVPEQYRETVENPIFHAEELTEEMVRVRCVPGDSGEGRDAAWVNFSVAFDSVVVDITAKNISPEWIYAQLDAMR
jgi:hypothetical protein